MLPRPLFSSGTIWSSRRWAANSFIRTMTRDGSKHWRRLEAEARLIALSLSDPKVKRAMLSVADGYGSIAMRADAQRAKRLMNSISYGPEALKAIAAAFDAAWEDIAEHFRSAPEAKEAARQKLATALLSIACEDSRSVEVLKRAALQRFALDYFRR
jgi:hypothetical protein